MKTSETVKQIASALAAAESKIKHATKDSSNPHYKNNYASLESVIDASKAELLDQGIVVVQGMNAEGCLVTRLQHTSGEFMESDLKLMLTKQDMQGLGGAITYARRYALAAMLNISQADDDGNTASDKANRPAPAAKKSKEPKQYTGPQIGEEF
jgi:hypothetical protein